MGKHWEPGLRRSNRIRLALAVALLVISGASTLYGFRLLLAYHLTPGATGSVPVAWPASSSLEAPSGTAKVLVFVHPFCACSFATIGELRKLVSRLRRGSLAPSIDVLFFRPQGSGWTSGSLWVKAAQLPGARLRWDEGGKEARRFGAVTSGFTLLYGSAGTLLFEGGVTGSRGHAGANYGIEHLAASLRSGKRASGTGLVFGCALGGNAE